MTKREAKLATVIGLPGLTGGVGVVAQADVFGQQNHHVLAYLLGAAGFVLVFGSFCALLWAFLCAAEGNLK